MIRASVETRGARGATLRLISMSGVIYEKIESERFAKRLGVKVPEDSVYIRFDVADSESQTDEANGRETLVRAYASPKFIAR